jgi:glycosyltransferase involved in cell wall biosynthesis
MSPSTPQLSIGLPVFNGERFLESALNSLLGQSYTDYELIIVDNASADATEEICRSYAARDPRIRYHRNPQNIGPAGNFYRSLELSSGHYYKYAADDDLYDPRFLEECLRVVERDPSVVCCFTPAELIDEQGAHIDNLDLPINTGASQADARLYDVIGVDYLCIQLYGVVRTDVFRSLHRYEGYYGWDRNLLADLALAGRIVALPQHLFRHRLHPKSTGAMLHFSRPVDELNRVDPSVNWSLQLSKPQRSAATRFKNYFAAVGRARLSPAQQARCYAQLARLIAEKAAKRLAR